MLNKFKIIAASFLLLGFGLAVGGAQAKGSGQLNSMNGTVYVVA